MGGTINIDGATAVPIEVTADNLFLIRNSIRYTLHLMSHHLLETCNKNMFGVYDVMLENGQAFTGSTAFLMEDEHMFQPWSYGDIDIQVGNDIKPFLAPMLVDLKGTALGAYRVMNLRKHGNELSVLMRNNDSHHVHQFDFQFVDKPWSIESKFLHSSSLYDRQFGIKGAHHKILLNAVGLDLYKFSITHGLRSRTDDSFTPLYHPFDICMTYFGDLYATEIRSFVGVVRLIAEHKSLKEQRAILDKFKDSVSKLKHLESTKALEYIESKLCV